MHSVFMGGESFLSAGRVRLLPSDPENPAKWDRILQSRLVLLHPEGRAPQSKGRRVKLSCVKTPLHKSLGAEKKLYPGRSLAEPSFPSPGGSSGPGGSPLPPPSPPCSWEGRGHSHANEGDFPPGNPLCFQIPISSPTTASFECRRG